MNTPRYAGSRRRALRIGGVIAADSGQCRQWLSLSPAERLEAASRLWLQSRKISRQIKREMALSNRTSKRR